MSETVRIEGGKLRVGEERFSLYSGAVHYWRIKPEHWALVLDKVKEIGFEAITTYIPWEIHEIRRGEFDFGQIEPSKDIDSFLTLCEEKGFKILARPGPQINSELTWFGFPRRILQNPEFQAVSAQGGKAVLTQVPKPIPALSYASDKFLAEVEIWYDAICPILKKHQPPHGNLVAVQVDNEMGYFFHINPYTIDYSQASLKLYRDFLKQKYGSIEELNSTYLANFASFDQVEPPRRFEASSARDLPYYLDWIEYREHYLIMVLEKLAGSLRKRGITVPLFHNYPHPLGPGGAKGAPSTPFNLPALEKKLDFVGFDIYSRKELYDHVKTIVSYVVGCSRYPFIPEFITGVWPWYINPGGVEDEEFVTKAALMHGIKGFSRYMVVERNKWLGSPINREGYIKADSFALHKRISSLMKKIDWANLQKASDVLLLVNRDYDRLEAAATLLPVVGDFLEPVFGFSEYPDATIVSDEDFGFAEPIQIKKSSWFNAFYNALTELGYIFDIGDTALDVEILLRYKAVVIPAFEFISESVATKLCDYMKRGGTVVLGPRIPSLSERFKPLAVLETWMKAAREVNLTSDDGLEGFAARFVSGPGGLVLISELQKVSPALDAILRELGACRIKKSEPRVDVVLHKGEATDGSQLFVLFVANPTEEAINLRVELPSSAKIVRDLWEDKEIEIRGDVLERHMPPYTIGIYVWKEG